MKLILALLLVATACYAGNNTMVGPATAVSSGQKILASTYNDNFSRIYSEVRGNIGTLNLIDDAVTTPKVASNPNGISFAKLNDDVRALLLPTGLVLDYCGATAPSGFVLGAGKTIGDAASGATERANADTQTLFTLIWNTMADAQAPVSTGRGANATDDFNAHKTITLPDLRGRVIAALDNLGGGTPAGRLTSAGFGAAATTIGLSGGSETHTLTFGEIPAHTHGITDPQHAHVMSHAHTITDAQHSHTYSEGSAGTLTGPGSTNFVKAADFAGATHSTNSVFTGITATNNFIGSTNPATTGITVNSTGGGSSPGGGAHTVAQPTYVLSKIIKLYYPAEVR